VTKHQPFCFCDSQSTRGASCRVVYRNPTSDTDTQMLNVDFDISTRTLWTGKISPRHAVRRKASPVQLDGVDAQCDKQVLVQLLVPRGGAERDRSEPAERRDAAVVQTRFAIGSVVLQSSPRRRPVPYSAFLWIGTPPPHPRKCFFLWTYPSTHPKWHRFSRVCMAHQ